MSSDAHDQGRGDEQLAGIADAAPRACGLVVRGPPDEGHHRDPGLEAGKAEGELGEQDGGHRQHPPGARDGSTTRADLQSPSSFGWLTTSWRPTTSSTAFRTM